MRRALAVFLLVVVMLGMVWAFQRRLIYLPSGEVLPPPDAGLPTAEAVTLRTPDGLSLGAWFVPAGGHGERPAPAVLVCNGNAGNRAGRAPLAAALAREGLAVLLFDYRGYGGNPGSPSEDGLLADAATARRWLLDRPDVDPERLVYFGESLGAGVAAGLADRHPPAALVLRSPFTSLADAGRVHYPFLPGRFLRDRYPVAEQVARYNGPLLVLAGAADGIVPPDQSRAVAGAAGGSARFVAVLGADHNDRALLDGATLIAEVTTFLADAGVLPPQSRR